MNNWITKSMIAGVEGCIFIKHVWMWGKRNKPEERILLHQKRSLNEELEAPLMHDCLPYVHSNVDLCTPALLAGGGGGVVLKNK